MASNYTFARTIVDKVLLWLHGRRFGLFGDGESTVNNSAVLDGVAIGSTRTGANSLKGVAAQINSTGAVTLTGSLVGDVVELVVDLTSASDVTSNFETTISVAGQIQQTTAGGNTHSCLFFINPQAAA